MADAVSSPHDGPYTLVHTGGSGPAELTGLTSWAGPDTSWAPGNVESEGPVEASPPYGDGPPSTGPVACNVVGFALDAGEAADVDDVHGVATVDVTNDIAASKITGNIADNIMCRSGGPSVVLPTRSRPRH